MKRSHYVLLLLLILLLGIEYFIYFHPDKSRLWLRVGGEWLTARYDVISKYKAEPEEIRIGYGYYKSSKTESFNNGVMMAVDEINQNPSGVYSGRKIKAVNVDLPTASHPYAMWSYAKDIVKQNVVATVLSAGSGGEYSIIGSAVFEKYRIINLWPYTTATKLTQHNFKYVFRNIPNNAAQTQIMAKACEEGGCKNVGIIYVRNASGEELANLLTTQINQIEDANVSFVQSYYQNQKDILPIINRLTMKNQIKRIDALYFVGGTKEAIEFISLFRDFNLHMPVIMGISQNDPLLLQRGANDRLVVGGSIVVGLFMEETRENAQFIKEYNQKYAKIASYTVAAQAYDSIMLLVEAMRYNKSTDADTMVNYLRYGTILSSDKNKSVSRRHSLNGDIQSHDYFLQIVREKKGKDGKMIAYFDNYTSKDSCVFVKGVSCLQTSDAKVDP